MREPLFRDACGNTGVLSKIMIYLHLNHYCQSRSQQVPKYHATPYLFFVSDTTEVVLLFDSIFAEMSLFCEP